MEPSIHYSGKIKDLVLIPQLIEEVKDVCTILGWRYSEDADDIAKGIPHTPIESVSI